MSLDIITKTVFFAADRETVWSFLTDKDKLGQWFHPADRNLAEGEEYTLLTASEEGGNKPICWGEVKQMNAPEKLVYSFTVKPRNGAFTQVSWLLEEANGGTRLTLVHEGVGEAAGEAAMGLLQALDAGWDEHFAKLRKAAA